jgi:hypothetical protein
VSATQTIGIANFGPLAIGTDVDDALLATLKTWMPTYLRQFHDERDLAFHPAKPRTYANTFEGAEFLDHQLPAIVCTTASLTATRGGPNIPYQGAWQSLVAVVVRGKQPAATRYLAAMYGGSVARCLLQKGGGAGGVCNDLHLVSARYEQVADATGQGRWLLAAVHQLAVFTDEIVQPWCGPDVPDADVYLDEATVVEIDLDVLGSQMTITEGPP